MDDAPMRSAHDANSSSNEAELQPQPPALPLSQVPVEDLTPEQASHIIHSHRKVRYGTACWPCRQRKVKCDNKHPCDNCVKREHPQLCSYRPNRPSAASAGTVAAAGAGGSSSGQGITNSHDSVSSSDGTTAGPSHYGRKRARSIDVYDQQHKPQEQQHHHNSQVSGSKEERPDQGEWPHAASADDEPETAEMSRYVGQNSIPALLRDQPSPMETKGGVDIRRDMRPILGLDNSAAFPLMSAKHLDRVTQDIFTQLPSDREVMKLFRAYKEVTHPFWGFVIDIDDLESRMMIYLEERTRSNSSVPKSSRPVSASWLAILFAVLAVGSQYHDSPYHVRTRDSQRYVQISFHFLQLGNFLLRPNLDSIQALLIVGFVLLNDMKAEGSWALIGMTCRLAQSLGLHRTPPLDDDMSPEAAQKNFARRKLWWTCQWHDTLTSLSFDRPNMTNIQCCPIPLQPISSPDNLSYLEAMYHLCEIISKQLNPDAIANSTAESILSNCDAIEALRGRMHPQLRSKETCKTVVDRLQFFALRLHTSFVISVCCRPSLRQDNDTKLSESEKKMLSEKCKVNLAETVRMFLAMHRISNIPTRSWAFTYHGLSSAVLLGIISGAEKKQDPEIRGLQGDLIAALSAAAARDSTSPAASHHDSNITRSALEIELSGPLSRALHALKNIYDHGTLHGATAAAAAMKSEAASRTRTPVPGQVSAPPGTAVSGSQNVYPHHQSQPQQQGFPESQQYQQQQQQQRQQNSQLSPPSGQSDHEFVDRHQDAALAMAELQNGSNFSEFPGAYSGALDHQQVSNTAAQQSTVMDFNGMDVSALAPMELYDSIFWESPDPFYTGVDMSFDFSTPPQQHQQGRTASQSSAHQQQFYF
ncbi:fungal-specific transcription factor domain-containing protein [Microdochium trichocladiopsis]|uniref:Fungal-specific transcription factor domain-containing protein n=1 Tax=Microdochium trichocladiopsis TaxID=1682393 RepID=A0A9P9BST7_9PEZI|nr:fungal-specific transcription factor domain-containing protein [Microdochium trichocladiopsis]KAH7038230.1 fungal-specific transcription factor domain-containing protein [Microdochium trichocladiopsis]